MEARRFVIKQTGIVALGQVVCIGVMFGIYAMLGAFALPVLWGGLLGGLLATLNFFFMAVGASMAADRAVAQDVKGGQGTIQRSMLLRYLVLFLVLFAAGKSGYFAPIALVVPLIAVRPTLSIGAFFSKEGE